MSLETVDFHAPQDEQGHGGRGVVECLVRLGRLVYAREQDPHPTNTRILALDLTFEWLEGAPGPSNVEIVDYH